ncbi:MAG TPA: hypothetical protein VE690_18775 [Rhodopila sp.]|nr:hypothetical protein [Rhodopila sp.]
MPAKPSWYRSLASIIEQLEKHPHPYVDRATVEFLFSVGRRRAQQIIAPCITDRVGSNGLADRDLLIAHLRRIARGEEVPFEVRRRRKVAAFLEQLRQERLNQPQLLVPAPVAIVNQQLRRLPAGVRISPGEIRIAFDNPQEALEKLLALAMAISNDLEGFERTAAGEP